jgi:hypothetical protein
MASDFTVGDRVRLVSLPPYLKTADPMPMLRPADTLQAGDEGIVLDRRPAGYWGIRFDRGAFLIDTQFLAKANSPEATPQPNWESPQGSQPDPAHELRETEP